MVRRWASFFRTYRDILTSDILHVRRADMQEIDGFMHVNARLARKALAVFFNPTAGRRRLNVTLPLYYTGLTTRARVWKVGGLGPATSYDLGRDYDIELPVDLPPLGIACFLIT